MITLQECIKRVKEVDTFKSPKQAFTELFDIVREYDPDLACDLVAGYYFNYEVVYAIHQMSDLAEIVNAVQRIDYVREDDVYYNGCGEFEDADLDDLKGYILNELKSIKEEVWTEEDDDFLTRSKS